MTLPEILANIDLTVAFVTFVLGAVQSGILFVVPKFKD